jgi:phospholipase/carboxylesterase
LHVVSVRAPLQLPGWSGYHWYVVPQVGHPDPETFQASFAALASCHDALWADTGIGPQDTVLAGFSMGTVMSYALGLGQGRPAIAGIAAFSGFIPTVSGWQPSLADRSETRAFIAHGRQDPVIEVSFGRAARDTLQAGGIDVSYHESDVGHQLDPANLPLAAAWLGQTLVPRSADPSDRQPIG